MAEGFVIAAPRSGSGKTLITLGLVATLRALGPKATAEQVRDWIANQTDFAGINGLYNFKEVPQRGLTVKNAVVTLWDPAAQNWKVVSEPTGVPVKK